MSTIDEERRLKFAGRNDPKNQLRGCRVKMNLKPEMAEKLCPFGQGDSGNVTDGCDLPEGAELFLEETGMTISLEREDIIFAEWICNYSAWIEGNEEAHEYSGIEFEAENAILLRLKHLEEARHKGFEARELRRESLAERARITEEEDEVDTEDCEDDV